MLSSNLTAGPESAFSVQAPLVSAHALDSQAPPASQPVHLDTSDFIDQLPISSFQITVAVFCAIVSALDGFDTICIGYVAPMVASAIGVKMSSFSLAFAAGLFGAGVGAFLFGALADRLGRKRCLVIACILFAAFTLLTMRVQSLSELLGYRFCAGLGLGGATPSFLALGSEYLPRKYRSFVITTIFSAFPFGGVVGGFVSAYILAHFDWRAVFLIGGGLPLVVTALIWAFVPESHLYLARRPSKRLALLRVLNRISPAPVAPDTHFLHASQASNGAPTVGHIFSRGRTLSTLLLAVPFFMGFMLLATITVWTPALLKSASIPLSIGALFVAIYNLGCVVGTAVSGYLMEKFGAYRMLVPSFLIGAIALATFGVAASHANLFVAFAAVIATGCFIGGSSSGLLALTASLFPSELRSSAIGWGMGAGRFGQVVGPLIVGALVYHGASIAFIYAMGAIPCIFAGALLIVLRHNRRVETAQ